MKRVDKVYKSSEYFGEDKAPEGIPEVNPNDILSDSIKGLQHNIIYGMGGIKKDVAEVAIAIKNFPGKSLLTVVGLLSVLYIGFKLVRRCGILN